MLTTRLQSVCLILDVLFQGLPQSSPCVCFWLAAHPTTISSFLTSTEPVLPFDLSQFSPHLQSVCLILKVTFQGSLRIFIGL